MMDSGRRRTSRVATERNETEEFRIGVRGCGGFRVTYVGYVFVAKNCLTAWGPTGYD
jgi:hypothetical protein